MVSYTHEGKINTLFKTNNFQFQFLRKIYAKSVRSRIELSKNMLR